jgi:phosphatidylglycerophosphate synthase
MNDDEHVRARVIPFPRSAAQGTETGPEAAPGDPPDEHDYAKPLLTLKKRSTAIRKAMLALPGWVTPNGVTLFRALLIIPIAWLLRGGSYWSALGVIAFAMLLDFVDGALAEARDQKTALGAFLDPLADKVTICGALLSLLDRLPAAFGPATAAVCVVAVLLTMVRIIKMARARNGASEPSVAAKPAGKLKLVAETASLLLVVIGLAVPAGALVWIGFGLLCIALLYALGSLRGQLFG